MIPRKSYLSASRPPTLVPYASPSHPDGGSRWLERDPNPVTREFQEFPRNFLGNGFTALLVGSPLGPYQGPTRAPLSGLRPVGRPRPCRGTPRAHQSPGPWSSSGSGFGLWLGWARPGFFLWFIIACYGLVLILTYLPRNVHFSIMLVNLCNLLHFLHFWGFLAI